MSHYNHEDLGFHERRRDQGDTHSGRRDNSERGEGSVATVHSRRPSLLNRQEGD